MKGYPKKVFRLRLKLDTRKCNELESIYHSIETLYEEKKTDNRYATWYYIRTVHHYLKYVCHWLLIIEIWTNLPKHVKISMLLWIFFMKRNNRSASVLKIFNNDTLWCYALFKEGASFCININWWWYQWRTTYANSDS
jgi:hypothetical protein